MPLQKLQFRPGVNREGTTLSNEGGWYDCDKVRFRSGFPEKIGGWTALSYNTFLGVCRSLWNWVTLKSYNLLGVGTNLKFYIESGGAYYDVTPIAYTTDSQITFTADTTTPSSIILVVDANASSLQENDFVTFSSAVSLGGNITADILNQEYQIVSVFSGTSYTISAREVSPIGSPGAAVLSNSSDVGDGGGSVDGEYQINTGFPVYTYGTGWGTGPWSRGAWGSGFTTGYGQQLRLWSQANYGEDLLFSPRGGALYRWTPGLGAEPDYDVRGTLVDGIDIPSQINQIMVSDTSRIVIAFGCSDFGAYDTADFDPLLIRWSAQEDYLDWTPVATNQAGSYRLSHGSEIIGALQTRQEILVWTNAAIYSMQYLGPPSTYGFTLLADNISVASPNVMVTASGAVFWMGVDKFYIYSGRVDTLPSTVRSYIFNDINRTQEAQFFAGTNEGFSEIWWYYCSKESDVIDRYVIYNYLEQTWYYGNLTRTAWLDSPIRQYPQAATGNNLIVYHEAAVDNGETNPPTAIESYVQSSDFDIGDGYNYGFVTKIITDITFDGSNTRGSSSELPFVNFTIRPRQNPGADYGTAPSPEVESKQSYRDRTTYTVQEFTEIVFTRVRGRQIAFKVSSDAVGTQWRLGVPRIDIRPDGRR